MEDLLSITIVTIIIILLIIYGIPSIIYLIIYFSKSPESRNVNFLLNEFERKAVDLNMNYNSLSDEYLLFCTYMPIKKLVFCKDGKNKELEDQNNEDLNNVERIFNKIKEIKEYCDNEYKSIKRKSDEKINENKKDREKREHEENLLIKKEAGENSRYDSTSRREWIINTLSGIFNFIKLSIATGTDLVKIMVSVSAIFGQLGKALLGNYVVMGFLILIFFILVILSVLKYRSIDTTTGGGGGGGGGGGSGNYKSNDGINLGFFSIYNDLLDTYSYYSKIANNFSYYTNNIMGNNNNENNGDENNGETIDREQLYGGKYDNLSYIKLNNLKINNIFDGSKNIIETEKDKYYNIYLPSEKFKDTDTVDTGKTGLLPWNIYENSKKEKIWQIDCESIDTIIENGKPAFITDNNKCIINKIELNQIIANHQDSDTDSLLTKFTTENIK
jgi:hypothetical protein